MRTVIRTTTIAATALTLAALSTLATLPSFSAPAAAARTTMLQKAFDKAVKKIDARFTPAEARPGQTVTFTLTLELHDGYYTYPTRQTDPPAAGMVNEIRFPPPSEVIFVGQTADPKNTQTKAEPELGILELRYCTGVVTYSRPAVVSPQAKPGTVTVTLPLVRISVCDKNNCFPPRTVPVQATLKVLDGPAVPVEPKYVEDVRKVLEKK